MMRFSIEIHATRDRVWDTLWNDETFRQWAGLIDPGTYMTGKLDVDNKIQFISAENGYGVTSLVEQVVANELLVLRHSADTQDNGENDREPQWTGGSEQYSLEEKEGVTLLTVEFDVPIELEKEFNANYPKALDKVKELSERTTA